MKSLRFFKHKNAHITFQGHNISLWSRSYWLIHYVIIKLPFKFYYSQFSIYHWEHVPKGKPVIFAITHRNAFMDSLAFVNTKNTQVFQLARGDAFNNRLLKKLFFFFHMLPIWRERDKAGNRNISNDATFNACYELLSKNQMLGIYPEGDCINENRIRPLKKGICRIAFGAMEAYNWAPDIQIVPVGVNYSDAEKFGQWQMIHFGVPISVAEYKSMYAANELNAVSALKDRIESGMRQVALHIPHSPYAADIENLSEILSRHNILVSKQSFNPITKFDEQKRIIAKLEHMRQASQHTLSEIARHLHKYQKLLHHFRFRENTFDPGRQEVLVMVSMALYFLLMAPVFAFGLAVNYLPYKLIEKAVEKKVKRRIFYSSLKYVAGIILYPIWYFLLFILTWILTGSAISGLLFLMAFPVAGMIAFNYWKDMKKWWSAIRFALWNKRGDALFKQMLDLRASIIQSVNTYSH